MKTIEHFITIINILFWANVLHQIFKHVYEEEIREIRTDRLQKSIVLHFTPHGFGILKIYLFCCRLAVNVFITSACPHEMEDAKAAYKSGEIFDQSPVITLEHIKRKLKESGIFDWQDPTLNEREKKELSKLFDAIEIMTTSRNRQPSSVQNVFSSLRLVERAVKKQFKEGQISETLAAKFHWEKLSARHRREKPTYYLDKKTSMRVFNTMN